GESRNGLKSIMNLIPLENYVSFISLLAYLKRELPPCVLDDGGKMANIFLYLKYIEEYLTFFSDMNDRRAFIDSLSYVLKDESMKELLEIKYKFIYRLLQHGYGFLRKTYYYDENLESLKSSLAEFVAVWYDYAKERNLRLLDEALNDALSHMNEFKRLALPHEKPSKGIRSFLKKIPGYFKSYVNKWQFP
ncbi:MAG: hypothetical protein GXN99_02505, partial [Candidatus Nanohaloarchaeota archaeon]|nr:hypothetical protein [Candidatus Nanohaloarchaeota archaeon]